MTLKTILCLKTTVFMSTMVKPWYYSKRVSTS